jgi:hypothetical protein
LKQSDELLKYYRRRQKEEEGKWKEYYNTIGILNQLMKDGLQVKDIFMAINILKNDYSQGDIQQLMEDINTYGTIAAARRRLQMQDEIETSMA